MIVLAIYAKMEGVKENNKTEPYVIVQPIVNLVSVINIIVVEK